MWDNLIDNLQQYDLVTWQWFLLCLCGVFVGIAKTGIPGFGILVVPLMVIALGEGRAEKSVGLLLPMLIFADVFAVVYHRRNAKWGHVIRLMPWAIAGIGAGFFFMQKVRGEHFSRVMGIIVLVMLVLKFWQDKKKKSGAEFSLPNHWAFAVVLGFTAGFTTMIGNAAGPVMILYLLAMGLPKMEFVGTAAWFFFFINWIKVPFHWRLGNIDPSSLKLDLFILPAIAIGAFLGIVALKRIPQKAFMVLIQLLTAAAAIKLIF